LGAALDSGAVPFFVMGQIRFAAEKLPGARLRSAIDAVFRTDLALKSSGGEPRILLERLVVELCGERKRR
jgi:DNA polymerase III delta subunit